LHGFLFKHEFHEFSPIKKPNTEVFGFYSSTNVFVN